MEKGYLSIVLHAHLPYVHHPESERYIEERWLFEAITETYIPLLDMMEGLVRDQVAFQLTMSMTPTLLSMLASPLLQERYVKHMDQLIELADKEIARVQEDEALLPVVMMYAEKFRHMRLRFVETYSSCIIEGFKAMSDQGYLEIITSSATHAFLPYIRTEQALRAQIENAVKVHRAHFGKAPRGIWLPECGYREELDHVLREFGIQFFMTDSHVFQHADPSPAQGVYAPIVTPGGIAAFARDEETSKQVWSAQEGYPGDFDYREYYRDIGYELDMEYLNPHLPIDGLRLNTGMKYCRITGNNAEKQIYNLDWARQKAQYHAGNFMFNREKQTEHLAGNMHRKPIIVASYDAELFGHWWYEGPMWLEELFRKLDSEQQTVKLSTPAAYLAEYPVNEQCRLSFSTWGRGGYGEVWLNDTNQWIYRHLHNMEEQMIELADRYTVADDQTTRALNQAARELLLAQSSDWPFIMDNRTMVDYAVRRVNNHVGRFGRIYEMLQTGFIDERWLTEVELRDNLFPDLDYQIYFSGRYIGGDNIVHLQASSSGFKVLMLAWEYPPMVVGGLSRHVYDLSRTIARLGTEVHVITCHVDGCPAYEVDGGVHVHRVRAYQSANLSFMEWILQLNLAMTDYASHLISHYGVFQLIHAHDWLVNQAAKTLKHQFGLPLVATIHATEHGRNQGIHTELQHQIHHQEWEMTYEAWRVIVCSEYMERELQGLFQLPADKLNVIPNGVIIDDFQVLSNPSEPAAQEPFALPDEKIIFYVGRMVREKGVHVLLESIPAVLAVCPEAKFVLAGRGPMLDELKFRAFELGISDKVFFPGFIDDSARNRLFRSAYAAVFPSLYEPFGIVAIEAMAAQLPVIVSGVGGLAEIVQDGEDGFTVLPGDVQSLSSRLIMMLQDESNAEAMARNAFHKVLDHYDWNTIARETIGTYRQVRLEQAQLQASKEAAATIEITGGLQ
ncbi:1,4-alpha-glucan branching protein domain-containing protein [Paenibacillus sp. OV219]|uniref:1,4-alpha-glucan branching protein domain-containing protein n=1 Tax=Paenibacillus sp. OV219 TaxID=1884377 RepID=UPI0008B7C01D|nr:1,4-alpha-glucan branching protein domain-containing protein [Paenibacillus sp. OV219]SEO02750.1 1,4-alpha-glucan branching enzyme [Paenibacillus sp. OV219]